MKALLWFVVLLISALVAVNIDNKEAVYTAALLALFIMSAIIVYRKG
ncbi:hypothetical protein [Candidatus Pyrohabitans sp.]